MVSISGVSGPARRLRAANYNAADATAIAPANELAPLVSRIRDASHTFCYEVAGTMPPLHNKPVQGPR